MATTKKYEVVRIVERVVPDQAGGFTKQAAITYKLPSGFVGTIEVPEADATEEKVKPLLDKEADRVKALFDLTG